MILNVTASGSLVFSDADLKKLAAAMLVVLAVTLRLVGGEISLSTVAERFKEFVDILAGLLPSTLGRYSNLVVQVDVLPIRLMDGCRRVKS